MLKSAKMGLQFLQKGFIGVGVGTEDFKRHNAIGHETFPPCL